MPKLQLISSVGPFLNTKNIFLRLSVSDDQVLSTSKIRKLQNYRFFLSGVTTCFGGYIKVKVCSKGVTLNTTNDYKFQATIVIGIGKF